MRNYGLKQKGNASSQHNLIEFGFKNEP